MNHLKAFPRKTVFIIILLLTPYLFADEELSDSTKQENKEVYIEEIVEEFEELKVFL